MAITFSPAIRGIFEVRNGKTFPAFVAKFFTVSIHNRLESCDFSRSLRLRVQQDHFTIEHPLLPIKAFQNLIFHFFLICNEDNHSRNVLGSHSISTHQIDCKIDCKIDAMENVFTFEKRGNKSISSAFAQSKFHSHSYHLTLMKHAKTAQVHC